MNTVWYFIYLIIVQYGYVTDSARIPRNSQYESSKSYGPFSDVHHGTELTKNKLQNYPTAPAEAFFGKGVHTHAMPIHTAPGATSNVHSLEVGNLFNIVNNVATEDVIWHNSHHVGGVDGGKVHNITWDPLIDKYSENLDQTNAKLGNRSTHPIYKTPVGFFGRSGHHHDMGLDGAVRGTPTTGSHKIGLPDDNIDILHSFQDTHDSYQHGHQLPGIKTYDTVNDTKHLNSFIPHHANYAGQQPVMQSSAIGHSSNPNLENRKPGQAVSGRSALESHPDDHNNKSHPDIISLNRNPFMNSSDHNPFVR